MCKNPIALGLLVVLLALAAGCGRSEPARPAIDIGKLDSGNYPTTPRTIERNADNGANQEGFELAKYVPLLLDLDRRLVFSNPPYGSIVFTPRHPPTPNRGLSDIADFASVAPGLVVGFDTRAQRRQSPRFGLDVSLDVLRFETPALAAAAVTRLADRLDAKYPPKGPLPISGYPDARGALTKYDSVETWLSRDEYLVHTFLGDQLATPPDPAPLLEFTKRILDRQLELLRDYRPTPQDKLAQAPVDIEGLLGRTLPSKTARSGTPGVFTAHAALHRDDRPEQTARYFADAKVDLVAIEASTIYRTGDADAAARLQAAFADQLARKYDAFAAPPGLPTAKCLKKRTDAATLSSDFTCYVRNDRYLAQVWSSQPQDLYQQAAAQYKLLTVGR
ncbi:hypothetical protein [Nocardia sp. NPDC052566]|uniref:DUF7373 family lipoprotein n=1 Tax=Nocardia sp. NPDC052566 TaxID=3364330 RepID=UPI0037CA14BF